MRSELTKMLFFYIFEKPCMSRSENKSGSKKNEKIKSFFNNIYFNK